jgi:mannosyl-oligosaccharide alpha-1,2-mannosidase
MGLEEEFEEAARAVDLIDFTTSPRADIPLFETTIRYLGGLLAAYDVSGGKAGKYHNLLDKAVELAEILMGAFDTPNRMPVLYYRWKPAFASQPHRASQRSNLAELGSLSMEFTRLAQLTKDPRYYDAIARVTDALSEYQDRGTKLGSAFPDNVDASGCNRTVPHVVQTPVALPSAGALTPAKMDEAPEGYQPNEPSTVKERRPIKKPVGEEDNTLELEIVPGELSKAHIAGWDDNHKSEKLKRGLSEIEYSNTKSSPPTDSELKRELPDSEVSSGATSTLAPPPPAADSPTGLAIDLAKAKAKIANTMGNWDCAPQGLDTTTPYGYDYFSMGSGQDSTYEYFPKVCVRTYCYLSHY